MRPSGTALATLLLLASFCAHAQYSRPPEPLLGVMHAPTPASPVADPQGRRLLMVRNAAYPSIRRVAEPYIKLAGVRVEPDAHVRHDMSNGYGIRGCVESYALVDVATARETPVRLPPGSCPAAAEFSPDGRRFYIENVTARGAELWIGDAATGAVRKVAGARLNPILDDEVQWIDGGSLLVKLVPANLGPMPKAAQPGAGAVIQQSLGGKGESSTYEARDTLSGPEDEAQFEYFARAQLARVDAASGKFTPVGQPGLYTEVDAAPDGRHVRVENLKRPFSHVTTYDRFAHDVEVINLVTGRAERIASLPVADRVPVRGVPEGARDFSWQANAPATLYWAEALDGGDWKRSAPQRDRLMRLAAPFTAKPEEVTRLDTRYAGLAWFADGSEALLSEFDANRMWRKTQLIDMQAPTNAKTLWDLSLQERYTDPGSPMMQRLPNGAVVVRREGDSIFLRGNGASPQGDRPFLDRYDLVTGKTQRLFRSAPTAYERVIGFSGDNTHLVTWKESVTDAPNAWLRTLGAPMQAADGEAVRASTLAPITQYPDPTPLVRQVQKRLVTYKRADGVDLSFTLYTPPGYKAGTRVPAILYAYPQDFAEASRAGQVSGSQQTFTRLSGYRLLLLAGYAIIDNAAFPIVGDPRTAYDTYLEQLVADAQAAVDKAVETGVVDRERIGVTGHSHGALMTVNLLAHSDLFRAGVATSGSYNKSLTPFGFQNERRSIWDARDVYIKASPFFYADKINEPLLLMHGQDDANPGTEPSQAPRLFQAIRGTGGTVRLVMLPAEPHWYTAMESNETQVNEMLRWFDTYVKNAPPRTTQAAATQGTAASK